jgi:hypothetical protein
MTTTNTESLPKPADSFIAFVDAPSRFLFFTGKGGVGKTSLACASAIALADRGRRVLLVSTDPASNLDEVLGQKLNGAPTPIPGVPNLLALNIDPEAAAHAYRERLVGPYRGKLPAWRNNSPALARWRSPPSMNFLGCLANPKPPLNSTTSFSTPPQPVTHCGS